METRIGNLITNLDVQVARHKQQSSTSANDSSFLNLVVGNSLQYDADMIHRLIISNNLNNLKEKLHETNNKIYEEQFQALSSLRHLNKENEEAKKKQIAESVTGSQTQQEHSITKPEIIRGNENITSATSINLQETEEDDLTQLRHRLLSRKGSSLVSSNLNMENQNDNHQLRQDSILNDMMGLVGQFRENMSRLNDSIVNDTNILNDTTKNLEKVDTVAHQVGKKMRVFNEQGKVGFWFYVYATGGLVIAVIVMLLIIRLVPRSLL
ncbi:hypothetical protein DASC09_021780 [Saccharomycopsis crataegensis]|uniref:t-SNARE coiled-coil homology domain-containing protein n=1 Tax=Saccharomycopsis crataegensis TaxID=43959 RepID=A0AAV5QJA1_9ASCO|nr:hypothetical protein DASC09_021780 [Saccharomycopsis crataegensis]